MNTILNIKVHVQHFGFGRIVRRIDGSYVIMVKPSVSYLDSIRRHVGRDPDWLVGTGKLLNKGSELVPIWEWKPTSDLEPTWMCPGPDEPDYESEVTIEW